VVSVYFENSPAKVSNSIERESKVLFECQDCDSGRPVFPSANIFWPPAQKSENQNQPTVDSRRIRRSSSNGALYREIISGQSHRIIWLLVVYAMFPQRFCCSVYWPLSGTLTLPFCFGQHVLHNSHNFSLRSALFNRLFLAFMWYFGHRSLLIFSYFGYACPGDWFSPVSWKSIKHLGQNQNQKPKAKENGNALKYGKEFFRFSGYA